MEFNKWISGVIIEVFPREGGWFVVELRGRMYAGMLAVLWIVTNMYFVLLLIFKHNRMSLIKKILGYTMTAQF